MKFYNYPKIHDFKDYDSAIESYINYIKKFPEVVSVYQIGSITVPGISDIDLVVVLNDAMLCNDNYSIFSNSNQRFPELFTHDVHIIPNSQASNLFKIAPIFQINLIYGENIIDVNIRVPTAIYIWYKFDCFVHDCAYAKS